MLKDIFPRGYQRYLSLPLLGSMLNKFVKFLAKLNYSRHTIPRYMHVIPLIDSHLRKLGCHSINKITRKKLLACTPPPGRSQKKADVAAAVNLLHKFFNEQKVFPPAKNPPAKKSLIEKKVFDYRSYLEKTRGFAPSTLSNHAFTISQFLFYLKKRKKFPNIKKIKIKDIEGFLCNIGNKIERSSLQHTVAHLRSFLRFLIMLGEIPAGIDNQIDTPRVYREEKLPHALSWEIVQSLLKSIDRSTPMGKRDYAVLLLITTYGLRASEIVALKLDDIDWRTNVLKIFQRKTETPLILPLTNAVGNSILDYLRKGRPSVSYREIFVKHRAPNGVLMRTVIRGIFQHWSRRSGLSIPFQGAHCLRHSYAIHLLRQGTRLKTIGDILGHRTFESTCVYLRLNVEDLRTVPLSLPHPSTFRRTSHE
jgi:integrase/recombinase XerD